MNKTIHLSKAFLGYLGRKTICAYPPTRLWIEPSSICNLSCGLCPNSKLPVSDKGNMDFGLFKRIIDEAGKFIHDVYLFHRGESLIHPQIFDMIRYIKGHGLHVSLHTNATLLSRQKSQELLGTGLDFISFSFDGYDKQTYEQARCGAQYEVTLQNILHFLRLKKTNGRQLPFSVLQVMEIGATRDQEFVRKKDAFLRQFQGLPLDKLIIREPHNWAGSVDVLKTREAAGSAKRYSPCPFLWYSQTILWDGSILPCCQDFMGELKIGTFGEVGLLEAWNTGALVSLRKNIIDKASEKTGPCRACDKLFRKTFLGVPVDYLGPFLEVNFSLFKKLKKITPVRQGDE